MFEIYTLFDITATGMQKNSKAIISKLGEEQWNQKRNQQRNWETIVQTLGLRVPPFLLSQPNTLKNNAKYLSLFGSAYHHINEPIVWKFVCSYEEPITQGVLEEDFNHIPLITNLTESFEPSIAWLETNGHQKNVLFKKLGNE